MKCTAICQSEQQVKWLIQQPKYSEKITHWVASNPSAYWALQQHNVPCVTLEDNQNIKSSSDIESLEWEQILWAKKVDEVLQERIPDFKSTGFNPAQNYLYYLKNVWDTWINRADLLESISKKCVPDTIIFFSNPYMQHYSEDLTPAFSLLSECIPLWAEHHGISLLPLTPIPGDIIWQQQMQMRTGIRRRIISKIPSFIVTRLQSLLNHRHFLYFPSGFRSSNIKGELLIRNSYDFNQNVIRHLIDFELIPLSFDCAVAESQEYCGAVFTSDPALNEAWYQIIESDWFWKPGGWQAWSLRTGFESLFHHFWFTTIPNLWTSFLGSLPLLKRQCPRAICVPSIWEPKETGFIMAAHSEHIPIIFYQHGACMGDIMNNVWDLSDCNWGDFILVYGEEAGKYLLSRPANVGSHAIPMSVGSSRLDQITQGISDKKYRTLRNSILKNNKVPLVVFVPGVIGTYFRYDYQDFRHCRIFDLRYRLAELFNNHHEVQFSYKAFISHGHDPTLEMLKETCPSCSIIDSIPLTELQWIADLIIHEVPGTGMYEGLVTDKHMIVYVDSEIYRMPPDVQNILGKRAIIAKTSQELINQVSLFLDRGNFSPLPSPDREFVKKFCTYMDDGNSAQRAAKTINDIIQKWPKKVGISPPSELKKPQP